LLTRMARSACALTACEPVAELTWGGLALACSPLRGTDGLCSSGRSAGLPGKRDARPGLGRTRGPAHRAGPRGQLLVWLISGSCRMRPQKAGGQSGL